MTQKRSRREYEADIRRQEAPFVIYGTPLPPLDDNVRDDGSYVPVWKQEVTDDRGRKRLHGAFTGGFSAGYFNTVGSKEGFTPSAFVSSRSNRAKDTKNARQQKIEDFMDDDDLREQDEARQIETKDGFAGFGTQDDPGIQNMLEDLVRPAEDTMGEKLLNRMGWKKGQGIGPRVRRKINPNDPNSETKEFPPEDSPMLAFSQKNDTKGLGFDDEQGLVSRSAVKVSSKTPPAEDESEDASRPGLSFAKRLSKPKIPAKTSAFGVGSLNDTGSDDEDPYEMGPKVSYTRILGGDKKVKKQKASTSNANPLLKTKPVLISKSKSLPSGLTSLRKCHDGKLPLTGFVLADELDSFSAMSLTDDKYKPLEVPEDWQPRALREAAAAEPQPQTTSAPVPSHQQQIQPQTAAIRAQLLNEPSLPSKSVFDYLTPAARERLAIATGNTDLPPALGEAPPTTSTNTPPAPTIAYPPLDPNTATHALSRLRTDPRQSRPYSENLQKQTRYKDFLRFSADTLPVAQRVPPLRAPEHKFSGDEHIAELQEFTATADLFKPALAGSFLASRFTSASTAPSKTEATEDGGSAQTGQTAEPGIEDLLTRPMKGKVADPAEEAARMGMFGPATRSVIGFFPTRLVCKRFGVEMPDPSG